MKLLIAALVLIVASFGVWYAVKSRSAPPPAEETGGVVQVESGDAEMNAAIETARASLGEFQAMLRAPCGDCTNFSLKVRFQTGPDSAEHIWVSDVVAEGAGFKGILDNDPQAIEGLKYGDRVDVPLDKISDWFYTIDGELVGAFTVKVLVDRATPEERASKYRGIRFRDPAEIPSPSR